MNQQSFGNRAYQPGDYKKNYDPGPQDFKLNSTSDDFEKYEIQKITIEKWIKDGIDKTSVAFANKFGEFIAKNGLTTSQIRATFGEMRRIQMNGYQKGKTDFILLKPKLAYAVKRHDKVGLTKFYHFFSIAYDAVDTKDDKEGTRHFENMMNLLEAVLAYHKFHGGRE